jgi:zinc-finger of transposase IS204/IS1001/IS1096/IS1165/Putative addiction module component
MRDTELYRAILGLTPPWTVGSVSLNVQEGQVVVRVEAGPGPFACPECGGAAERYDSRPRRWRHLDTCQLTTWIEADVPRIDCAAHGSESDRDAEQAWLEETERRLEELESGKSPASPPSRFSRGPFDALRRHHAEERYRAFPFAGCPFKRNVFGSAPSPQILNDPKSLYQGPAGASGSDSRHSLSL